MIHDILENENVFLLEEIEFVELITDSTKFFISMISILNPIGALPLFITLTRSYSQEEIHKVATNCSYAIFITLVVSLVGGSYILHFFGISILSFRLAGGILISMTALSMLKAQQSPEKLNQEEMDRQTQIKEIGIVPLAIPMLAGPGSISTCIIHSEKLHTFFGWFSTLLSLSIMSLIIFFILINGRKIREKIGRISLNVMTRIMGLILLAVAVEYISGGLKGIFPLLNQ